MDGKAALVYAAVVPPTWREILSEEIEGELVPPGLTVKAFSREYRAERDGGHPLTGRAFSHEEVRSVLIDLLDKLSWIADSRDVRKALPGGPHPWDQEDFEAAGYNDGLDEYQRVILETKRGLENLNEPQEED